MKMWDYKKEQFVRHRLACFLSEERKEGQRQNTAQYGISQGRCEEVKLYKQVIKMMHYLPEVLDYFKFYPMRRLLINDSAFLTQKVPEMNFADFQEHPYTQTPFGDQQVVNMAIYNNLRSRRKSGGPQSHHHANQKLKEMQHMLPYLLLSTDYSLVTTASSELQKLMVFGDFKTRIAMMDQMLYMIKELILEAPEEYLVSQILQQLIKMIKIWHTSEKTKVKITSESSLKKRVIDGLEILSLCPESHHQNSETESDMLKFQYIFQSIDMLVLLGICNKDRLVRQLSVILMAENGKLQRLMIPKKHYQNGIYDIIYYNTQSLQESIIEKLMIICPLKLGEFKSIDEIRGIITGISPFLLLVDNFDYKRAGLNESTVRDIQIILMGELFIQWKKVLIVSTSGSSILNFINIMSSRTLSLFETSKSGENEFNATKDYLGLNLLMAITLYNVSHSHINLHVINSTSPKQTDNSSSDNTTSAFQQQNLEDNQSSSQQSAQQAVLSTNSVLEDYQHLVSLLELDISEQYKSQFGKFYPSRFSISSVILAFYYQFQDPHQGKSIENLKEIFQYKKDQNLASAAYLMNCLIFYSLLTVDANKRFMAYIHKDQRQLTDFSHKVQHFLFKLEDTPENAVLRKQKLILLITYVHGIIQAIGEVFTNRINYKDINKLINAKTQYMLLEFTKREHDKIEANETLKLQLGWLLPKIKEIWHSILSFGLIFGAIPNIKFDLKFLVSLESEGFKVLKYYKYLHNNNPNMSLASESPDTIKNPQKNLQENVQQEFSVSELKHLLNQVYLFYNTSNVGDQLLKKNTYYKCFTRHILGADVLFTFLQQKNFNQVYGQLTSSCLRSSKTLIESKLRQFISHGLHSKYFLVGLFMSLNAMDHEVIRDSKILCLCTLPLMFEDEKFRETVESMICEHSDLESLVRFDNKGSFYRFVKQVFKDEEAFNMRHHFERYFSISGLLRNLLNEVIKLQSLHQHFNQRMLLKILDIITYFIGTLQLRRAPIQAAGEQSSSFIFDNLIDYKSFEFLSKLYKISEKLVDYDDESTVMNMWYKLVEGGKLANFEILSKFLVHNLSSFIMKIKSSANDRTGNSPSHNSQSVPRAGGSGGGSTSEYSLEYEKQKRYALSIFNYIKARVQQMDLRNSINVSANSISWSQKMIKLMAKAALNLQSKYVLEKIKLKKLLQILHSEINECGVRLQLRGGLMQSTELQGIQQQRMSLSMSDLLQSETFLETFAARNRKQMTIMKNLIFRVKRIMSDKFGEIAGAKSIDQMPDLIIKYFENSLVFITNDVERPTQVIQFSVKEELTVVIVMIILTVDLIIREKNENRFYFLLETFNKLSIHVGSVAKYFNFKYFTLQVIFSKEASTHDKLWQIVNLKQSIDHFVQFTKLHFKILQNLTTLPVVQYHLIRMWLYLFQRHRDSLQQSNIQQLTSSISDLLNMKSQDALQYSRKLILTLLQNAFFNVCDLARVTSHRELTQQQFKYISYNFKQHFLCILDYVIPPQSHAKPQAIQSPNDPESVHVAFATNAIFWVAYSCLECASIITSENGGETTSSRFLDLAGDLQAIGMSAINRVLEKSDFLKMLIGVTKLSQNFYSYSLSMSKGQSSFLSLIFDALDNPKSIEDAMKSLIITIRVQDYQLLNISEKRDLAEIELQRLLYLTPYLMQQFNYILQQQINPATLKGKQPIFGNYRSIVLLLKKSLPSIGIDKKKGIFEQLDLIQREAEKSEEHLIRKEFKGLIEATVSLLHQLGYSQVIQDCETTFMNIKEDILGLVASGGSDPIIDEDKLDLALGVIDSFSRANDLSSSVMDQTAGLESVRGQLSKDLNEFIYTGELLGEEAYTVIKEMRPLYFGLKNIILKEIDCIDKDIDIQKFFFDQSVALLPFENQEPSSLQSSATTHLKGVRPGRNEPAPVVVVNTSTSSSVVSPALIQNESVGSNSAPEQQAVLQGQVVAAIPDQIEADFSNVVKKISMKRQETTSKYQNSQPTKQFNQGGTPLQLERRITEISIGGGQSHPGEYMPYRVKSPVGIGGIEFNARNNVSGKPNTKLVLLSQQQQQLLFDDDEIVQMPLIQQQQLLERQISVTSNKTLQGRLHHHNINLDHHLGDTGAGGLQDQAEQQNFEDVPCTPSIIDNSEFYYEAQEQDESQNQFEVHQEMQDQQMRGDEQQQQEVNYSSSEDIRAYVKNFYPNNNHKRQHETSGSESPSKERVKPSQVLYGRAGTTNTAQLDHFEAGLNPLQIIKSQSSNFQERVEESKNVIYHQGDQILTFCKPNKATAVDQSHLDGRRELQTPSGVRGQKHQVALIPNYVADRTSSTFSDLDYQQSEQSRVSAMTQQNFYRGAGVGDNDEFYAGASRSQVYQRQANPLSRYPWLREQQATEEAMVTKGVGRRHIEDSSGLGIANDLRVKKNNFTQSEAAKTGGDMTSDSQQLQIYLSNPEKQEALEDYLVQVKGYDVDLLHFYLDVLDFKQETADPKKANLIAGHIIDTYFSESAEHYLQMDSRAVVADFERWNSEPISFVQQGRHLLIFDTCTAKIKKDLIKMIEEMHNTYE